jgi:DNA (cytosine-5)-methyltransferase 1
MAHKPVNMSKKHRLQIERASSSRPLRFVDLYAGCGGLSLGLMMAGWKGVCAVEKDKNAFESLSKNLIYGEAGYKYDWPCWLPKNPLTVALFLKKHRKQIAALKGQVDLVVGGPPCQGFSMAGKRKKDDPRNAMFRHYVQVVSLVRPPLLLLENVRGIDIQFGKTKRAFSKQARKPAKAYSIRIKEALERIDYRVFGGVINAKEFGVPQSRLRYFLFALDTRYLGKIDKALLAPNGKLDPFALLGSMRTKFLSSKGLPLTRPVTVSEAISDLGTRNKRIIECIDSLGFNQVAYKGPTSSYQKLLHGKMNGASPNSMRLVNHRKETVARFNTILKTCRRGVMLSQADRKRLGMRKHATVPLDGKKPSHTLTTLPDDILHYSEPRILTVRESARLQSFPDFFEFKGKYTTGGKQRVKECPRYTQVGNAVPPLVAEVMGLVLARIILEIILKRAQQSHLRRRSAPKRNLRKAA